MVSEQERMDGKLGRLPQIHDYCVLNQLDDDRTCNGNDVYGMDKSFLDWNQFQNWVNAKYAKTYARIILQHTKKYHLIGTKKLK